MLHLLAPDVLNLILVSAGVHTPDCILQLVCKDCHRASRNVFPRNALAQWRPMNALFATPALVRFLVVDLKCPLQSDFFELAASQQNPRVLDQLCKAKCPMDRRTAENVAKYGRLSWIRKLRDHGLPWSDEVAYFVAKVAAWHGHMNVLKYAIRFLLERGVKLDDGICNEAVKGKQMEALKYLHSQDCCAWTKDTFLHAIITGELHMVRYLYFSDCEVAYDACDFAVEHLDTLKFLLDRGLECDEATFESAAQAGNLEVIRFLDEIECPLNSNATFGAAREDHLEILQYLHETMSFPLTDMEYFAAIEGGGHLRIVQYLYETAKIPVHVEVSAEAALHGHTHIVRYFHDMGECVDYMVMRTAVRANQMEVVQYLNEYGWDDNWGTHAMFDAVQYGRTDILQYLHESDCCFADYEALCEHARDNDQLEAYEYLQRNAWNAS